jgi:NAD(P)-dependent dehydrogenase (short-subunit alcohol dehydrogenase family)
MAFCQKVGALAKMLEARAYASCMSQEALEPRQPLKTALITGGGRGLGAALGRELARRGLSVVLVARTAAEVEAAALSIRKEGGVAHALVFDVADKEAIHRVASLAAGLVGPIDVLVNNASSLGPVPMPLLLDTECEDFAAVLETNLVGPFRLTKAVAGNMVLRERGAVVFVSSDAAVSAYSNWGSYGVSKAASDHLAKSFAAELEPHGVRVFAVDPGEMDTEMHAAALPDADRATLERPEKVAAILADMLVGAAPAKTGTRFVASEWRAT